MVKTRAQRKAKNNVHRDSELEDDGPEFGLDSRTKRLCNLVFGIELLREAIIDFVITDHKDYFQGLSKQNAYFCRLVQKSWLESVFKCLVKSGKWLVELGRRRSIESFFKIYNPSSPLPFKLTTPLITDTVEPELEKCLQFCNNGLVELELQRCSWHYWYSKFKSTKLLQQFTLPKLRKLTYYVEPSSILDYTDKKNNGIDIHFVPQSILSRSCNLKHFELSFTGSIRVDEKLAAAAASFGNLLLPRTIKNLKLDCQLGTHNLEFLLKINMLSNLTDLTVDMPCVKYGDSENFYRLLNRVCYTLKNLTIHGGLRLRNQTIATIDPPVMKCLKLIRILWFEWADGITDLHMKLPALEKLDLKYVRSCSLKKWVNNSKFDLVTDLNIEFYDQPYGPTREKSVLTIHSSQLMCKAFLKVTKLKLLTLCVDTTYKALQCLFQHMTQLQVLSMTLETVEGHLLHLRYLDALVLGISCELIDKLKSECAPGKLWETVQLNLDEQHSVVNLSQLRELTLYFSLISWDPLFVSKKVESFLVSKMPNLQTIELPRPDEVLEERTRTFKENGRIYNWE